MPQMALFSSNTGNFFESQHPIHVADIYIALDDTGQQERGVTAALQVRIYT
jgi:hypothetical protein